MGDAQVKRSIADRFWGSTVGPDRYVRVTLLVFVAVAIFSMSFSQLGFWSIGVIDGKSVYLMFLLAPLMMGALLFGPLAGAALGLFAGAVVFAHATFFPLDYYEIYFMTPSNTFVLLTFVGAVAGALFARVLRGNPQGLRRAALIAVICFALSFVTSGLVQLNTVLQYGGSNALELISKYLLISPAGFVVQALLDGLIMSVLCLVVEKIVQVVTTRQSARPLHAVFTNWMYVSSFVVFMLVSALIFSYITLRGQEKAATDINSELTYLTNQLNRQVEMRDEGGAEREAADPASLLEGYSVQEDGWVAITDKQGVILASDDVDHYPPGKSFLVAIDWITEEDLQGDSSGEAAAQLMREFDLGSDGSETHDINFIQATDANGVDTLDILYLGVRAYDDGYVGILYSFDKVHQGRSGTMLACALLAIALIATIVLVASRLLSHVVVRRIDQTNDSLGKITNGDLNERIRITDSREFVSLSNGINTTVDALRDSIAEAEQRNAQELAAAKAIQESALPTDFPAFPDIDRFDIYASMKTAKEVGGDFYDFFLIEGTSKVGFVMADVSGKGIPAALFMMTSKTQVRTYMESNIPIDEAVNAANHQLCLSNETGMFVTMVACVLDYETGELTYVNAGHNPPLILHDGKWEWLRDVSGMPMGLFDGIPYEPFSLKLDANDTLYLYTDGVTEAMKSDGTFFGEDRLHETLGKYTGFNPRSVCVGVRRALTDFTQDCEQSDDITMLALKYGVPPEEKAVMILDAKVDQLVHVHNYIHAELHRRRAPKSVYNPLDIAAEELFVNVCHYAYPNATPENPGQVRISFEYSPNPPSLTVQIADDGIPYNPLAKPDAVTPDDVMDVPIGGLGILMAKRSVDDMTYERVDNSNILTFKKVW